MSRIEVKDGTTIYYKDWGNGPVVMFSHGWPLNSDAWDGQLHFLAENGFRVIAHDRRGHGRSGQAWSANDMNGYADDLAAVIETLDFKGVTLVGHSTGGGEVARYIGRHGTKRVAAAVLGRWISSGYGACKAASRTSSIASKHFRRLTLPRTSRNSICPL